MADIVFEFEKNPRNTIRASTSDYRGQKRIDVRMWYKDEQGELKPSKQGISLPIEMFGSLKKLILDLEQALLEKKLI